MALPRADEGGLEIFDLCPDVTAAGDIIPLSTAWHAARTALRYFNHADDYEYVKRVHDYDSESGIVEVGVWSPLEYNPKGTIIGNPSEVNRSMSFVRAAKALARFAGTTLDEEYRVKVMVMMDGDELGFHQDKYEGARSTLQLMGYRSLSLIHTSTPISAQTDAFLFQGDAYRMQFRPDYQSVVHGISYLGHGPDLPNVGLYINA